MYTSQHAVLSSVSVISIAAVVLSWKQLAATIIQVQHATTGNRKCFIIRYQAVQLVRS